LIQDENSPQSTKGKEAGWAGDYHQIRPADTLSIKSVCSSIIADHYGRHFVRVLRHPTQYWGWLLLFAALIAGVIATGVLMNNRLQEASAD
jgi:hypothetical protein